MMHPQVDVPTIAISSAIIFYFILNIEYHPMWVLPLFAIWLYGIKVDFASTFERPGMLQYEKNFILIKCLRRYGQRRGIVINVIFELIFVLGFSIMLARPIGFNVMDFAFVAGLVGTYHTYCAKSNYAFCPE